MHFKKYRFLEIILDTKHLKHKTLLNKVSVYFGVNIYSQQIQNIFLLKIILVNLHSPFNLSLSKQGGDVQTDPQNAVCLKEAKQVLSRHNRQLYLTMLPPNSNILQTVTNTDEMFCVKLKPLASNKCTLVPASMKGTHHPLTNAEMSKCSSPLLTHTLDLHFSQQVPGKVGSSVPSVQPAPVHLHWKLS